MLDLSFPALPGGAATLLRWLADEGATVARGTPLAIVVTGAIEVALPAPAAGTLARLAAEGAILEPGAALAQISQTAEAQQPKLKATPLAHRMARVHGLELATLTGSGPHGIIRAADVRARIAPASAVVPAETGLPAPPAEPSAPPSPELPVMQAPLLTIAPSPDRPIATLTYELDTSNALARIAAMREQLARLRLEPGLTACVVEAVGATLPAHPLLNARWGEDSLVLRRRVHVAVGQPGDGRLHWGLVADAGDLTLRGIARALAGPADDAGERATFTVVGLERGVTWQTALPPLPNTAAALSVGAPVLRPAVTDTGIATRPIALLTLSYDARVVGQQEAACFMRALRDRLIGG